MQKRKLNRKEIEKEDFLKKINPVLKSELWMKLNPFLESQLPSIDLMFRRGNQNELYGFPFDKPYKFLEPLVNAIDNENRVVLRVNLNRKRETIEKEFSVFLTIVLKLLKEYRGIEKFSDREFDLYWMIYNYHKNMGWTFERIAQKIFPRDFVLTEGGSNFQSALTKTKQIFKTAKRLIEGE